MNELLTLVATGIICFMAGVVAVIVYALSAEEAEPPLKAEDIRPLYTEEELQLAQFLEDKQAVNEAFLSVQTELLKEFRE